MTTILQPSLPGASPFDQIPLHSSYSDLSSFDLSMPYRSQRHSRMALIHPDYDGQDPSSAPSSAPSSPQLTHSSFSPRESYDNTPASSNLSLDGEYQDLKEVDEEEDMGFPTYDQSYRKSLPQQEHRPTPDPDLHPTYESKQSVTPAAEKPSYFPHVASDDSTIAPEPTRHVDYLSHEWREQDIWSSWRYIVARRKKINNDVRLENAAWRTWLKTKNNLKTISPESLNWLKDCDVTWLYGPLQVDTKKSLMQAHTPPPSRLSSSSSFVCKPILKKKSASATILERSRSQHSLLQRASDIIRIQQSSPAHGRPILGRAGTNFTLPSYTDSSVANTPDDHETPSLSVRTYSFSETVTPAECKHVLFNEEVRQVQAIDSEDDEKDGPVEEAVSESDEDEDGGLVMAPKSSTRSTPRSSFSNENKTIVPLPSTTLKSRADTPEPRPAPTRTPSFWGTDKKLSPSPSQETLRPSRPSHNFLIDDDAEITDEPWQESSSAYSVYEDEDGPGQGMRRTASGMFMPYDEDEDEAAMNNTLFGQAVYAINTFKDIAHVVWNVGWNRK